MDLKKRPKSFVKQNVLSKEFWLQQYNSKVHFLLPSRYLVCIFLNAHKITHQIFCLASVQHKVTETAYQVVPRSILSEQKHFTKSLMPHLLNENLFNTPRFMIKTSKRPRAIYFLRTILGIKFLQNMVLPIAKIRKKEEDMQIISQSQAHQVKNQNELHQVVLVQNASS